MTTSPSQVKTRNATNTFSIGSLVRARGREWVVLPTPRDLAGLVLRVRPLNGGMIDETGLLLEEIEPGRRLEPIEVARLPLPGKGDLGDHQGGLLLRDAARFTTTANSGSLRCLGNIGIVPRAYQLVPLVLAMRQDPVRLMLADDVGVGKTIEACLIARELWDRGEVSSITVLCPPHLAEQWVQALRDQFHFEQVALVLSSTAARLERQAPRTRSLFEHYPVTVVSMDYIKSPRRRDEFLRTCPDLVIVDEAHTCANNTSQNAQRRHQLLKDIVAIPEPKRHLILVTATPHTGKHEPFCSLIELLDSQLAADLRESPQDLSLNEEMERTQRSYRSKLRKRLSEVFVQRRRRDLATFLEQDTPFPTRERADEHYTPNSERVTFMEQIFELCQQALEQDGALAWWSMLSVLRAASSSPAAAAATLRNRADVQLEASAKTRAKLARDEVFELDEEAGERSDEAPVLRLDDHEGYANTFTELAEQAAALEGKEHDYKLARALDLLKAEVQQRGRRPIVFCHFVHTAHYVAAALREELPNTVEVECITGRMPHAERESRVAALAAKPTKEKAVLVCTDCLSEGMNLQEGFDLVFHYDLSWNPTRHEQRDGRVDRFGQPRRTVYSINYTSSADPVDQLILRVLHEKHDRIRETLGVSVPVPDDDVVLDKALKELFEGWQRDFQQELLLGEIEAKFREDESLTGNIRTYFRHEGTQRIVDEHLTSAIEDMEHALGTPEQVHEFVCRVFKLRNVAAEELPDGALRFSLVGQPLLAEAAQRPTDGEIVLLPPDKLFASEEMHGAVPALRTHPVVRGLARFVFEEALDDPRKEEDLPVLRAARASVIYTNAVDTATTLVLLRARYHIRPSNLREGDEQREQLVEEILMAAFEGLSEDRPQFTPLPHERAQALLAAEPIGSVPTDMIEQSFERLQSHISDLYKPLYELVADRAKATCEATRKLSEGGKSKRQYVHAIPPLKERPNVWDILGLYTFLPTPGT